jgi:hypothetical protein
MSFTLSIVVHQKTITTIFFKRSALKRQRVTTVPQTASGVMELAGLLHATHLEIPTCFASDSNPSHELC